MSMSDVGYRRHWDRCRCPPMGKGNKAINVGTSRVGHMLYLVSALALSTGTLSRLCFRALLSIFPSRFCAPVLLIFTLILSCSCIGTQQGEDKKDSTAITRQPTQDSQNRTARTWHPKWDRQNRTGRTRLAQLGRQNKTARKWLPDRALFGFRACTFHRHPLALVLLRSFTHFSFALLRSRAPYFHTCPFSFVRRYTARRGQQGQDSQNKTANKGQPVQDSQNVTSKMRYTDRNHHWKLIGHLLANYYRFNLKWILT